MIRIPERSAGLGRRHLSQRLALAVALLLASRTLAQLPDTHFRIDQFGYRPDATKVAVLRVPLTGYDAPDPWTPGPLIEVRRAGNQSVAFSGAPAPWHAGATHAQSGDRVWWFDFSALHETGTFYLFDPSTLRSSETFDIRPDVYRQVYVTAQRMFYYQRCGTPKATPFAQAHWADGACHVGAQQDTQCRAVQNPVPATARDLSGGWHDAGDYNKYVNFADDPVHALLYAFDARPGAFPDDTGIPESGNGVPDILDEVKWELDWFRRMQNPDGSVLHKVSVTAFVANSPPSTDTAPRRYAPATASATISLCGAFAHAARSFGTLPQPAMQAYAVQLQAWAIAAWNWLVANPTLVPSNYNNAGFVNVSAEDDAYTQQMNRLRAAVHLFALTGQPAYRTFVDSNYQSAHLLTWWWASAFEGEVQDALLEYAALPGATPSVAALIRSRFVSAMSGTDHLLKIQQTTDAYRSFLYDQDYTWGSNRTKSDLGWMHLQMVHGGLDLPNSPAYLGAAEDYLHYFHGVNPLGYTFLTNMASFGAGRSVNETYHAWFADGSVWDNAATSLYGPPPGYLTGGVNPSFAPDPSYTGPVLAPPQNQPVQKSYRDWNTSWPEDSWEVTECQMSNQAAYVRLVSAFAVGQPASLVLAVPEQAAVNSTGTFAVSGATPLSTVAIVWGTSRGSFVYGGPGWCVDLGLAIGADPFAQILVVGTAGPDGRVSWSFTLPPILSGQSFLFQATQAGTCPNPAQSIVVRGSIQ